MIKYHNVANSRNVFPGIEQSNEAYNLMKNFTTNESYNLFDITHLTSRPLPTPAILHVARTPSPTTHIYDEPKVMESIVLTPRIEHAQIKVSRSQLHRHSL